MKKLIVITSLLSLAGCASPHTVDFVHATPDCKSAVTTVKNQPVTTQFCIKTITGRPSLYRVSVNDQAVFTGTDYEHVSFEKNVTEGAASGDCKELIEARDGMTSRLMALNDLPPELVVGCHITADAAGNSQPFTKDAACDKVFYKALMPVLGKVMPIEVARQCTVKIGQQTVFDDRFNF